jgi:hypothetical protein
MRLGPGSPELKESQAYLRFPVLYVRAVYSARAVPRTVPRTVLGPCVAWRAAQHAW